MRRAKAEGIRLFDEAALCDRLTETQGRTRNTTYRFSPRMIIVNEPKPSEIFWEIHSKLPREGPGDDASTRKAFSMLADLPNAPCILDVGCGPRHADP